METQETQEKKNRFASLGRMLGISNARMVEITMKAAADFLLLPDNPETPETVEMAFQAIRKYENPNEYVFLAYNFGGWIREVHLLKAVQDVPAIGPVTLIGMAEEGKPFLVELHRLLKLTGVRDGEELWLRITSDPDLKESLEKIM